MGLRGPGAGYMAYLRELFPLGDRKMLAWVEGGNKAKDLLTVINCEDLLGYSKVSGNCDAAIATEASCSCYVPETGLCVLFSLKKEVTRQTVIQAMGQLLNANILSSHRKPVVVLTDLQAGLWIGTPDGIAS
ncbi:hypothetical protein GPECTOR_9g513 [Gonium pectorale]|uniref:Uncharacterized protein n=1 Tax=Gonium pectorale TaxID=33097 RepID=A0A150GRK9_GONPE|nr:hypothetical protein GPECTOR_9g513 [Gonium pectorale]|eukprot:KXZ52469.1 hypothetical protein GPECTOR_9g513 [Gonium pectorale]